MISRSGAGKPDRGALSKNNANIGGGAQIKIDLITGRS